MISRAVPQVPGFTLLEPLGTGASATVWSARRQGDGELVALKILRPDVMMDAELLVRLKREARLGARLEHPHLVRQLAADMEASPAWIAMELAHGGSLEARIGARIDGATLLGIARDLLEVLAYLHENGVLHRDIKPANILFAKDGRAMLGDLGLMRYEETVALTAPGVMVGTLAYLAPELFQGARAHPGSDLFSLGVCLYAALTGRHPRDHQPMHPGFRAKDPATLVADCPGLLRTLILELMEPDPGRRPQAARPLVLRLEGALRRADDVTVVTDGGLIPPEPAAVSLGLFHEVARPRIVAVATLLVCFAGVLSAITRHPHPVIPVTPTSRVATAPPEEIPDPLRANRIRDRLMERIQEYHRRARIVSPGTSVLGIRELESLANLPEVSSLLTSIVADLCAWLEEMQKEPRTEDAWLDVELRGAMALEATRAAMRTRRGPELLAGLYDGLARRLPGESADPVREAVRLSLSSHLGMIRNSLPAGHQARVEPLARGCDLLEKAPEGWRRSPMGLYHRLRWLDTTILAHEGAGADRKQDPAGSDRLRAWRLRALDLACDLSGNEPSWDLHVMSPPAFWGRVVVLVSGLLDARGVSDANRRRVVQLCEKSWIRLGEGAAGRDRHLGEARTRLIQAGLELGIELPRIGGDPSGAR